MRIDRPTASPQPTGDQLTRRKASLAVSLKTKAGTALLKRLICNADILIDPYRPGVLEKLGFGPDVLLRMNPKLIFARLTGFRRDGPYRDMAGHDINYISLAGVLALLGREGEKPYAPGNLLADFAGGGLVCFTGILLALLHRTQSGHGQVVEANMVDGAAYLATFPRLAMNTLYWNAPRGQNLLDGGCPWYDTYETKDGLFVAVGCLEPQFYEAFLKGLGLKGENIPPREARDEWPQLKALFADRIHSKPRKEWDEIFAGTDACVTPVLTYAELKASGFGFRPPVHLSGSPGLAVSARSSFSNGSGHDIRNGQGAGVEGDAYKARPIFPGQGGDAVLSQWMGWTRGKHYDIQDGGCILLERPIKSPL